MTDKTLRPIKILVTGGRLSTLKKLKLAPDKVSKKLAEILTEIWACGTREVTIIHGGADGVDSFANTWAFSSRSPTLVFPIPKEEWDRVGNIAGNLRNTKMLKEGKPDVAIAMPGGGGTADMVMKLKEAKIRVMEVTL